MTQITQIYSPKIGRVRHLLLGLCGFFMSYGETYTLNLNRSQFLLEQLASSYTTTIISSSPQKLELLSHYYSQELKHQVIPILLISDSSQAFPNLNSKSGLGDMISLTSGRQSGGNITDLSLKKISDYLKNFTPNTILFDESEAREFEKLINQNVSLSQFLPWPSYQIKAYTGGQLIDCSKSMLSIIKQEPGQKLGLDKSGSSACHFELKKLDLPVSKPSPLSVAAQDWVENFNIMTIQFLALNPLNSVEYINQLFPLYVFLEKLPIVDKKDYPYIETWKNNKTHLLNQLIALHSQIEIHVYPKHLLKNYSEPLKLNLELAHFGEINLSELSITPELPSGWSYQQIQTDSLVKLLNMNPGQIHPLTIQIESSEKIQNSPKKFTVIVHINASLQIPGKGTLPISLSDQVEVELVPIPKN